MQVADASYLQEYLDSLDAVEVLVNLAGMFTYGFKFEEKYKQETQHDRIKINTMVYMLDNLVKIPVKFFHNRCMGTKLRLWLPRHHRR